MYDDNSATRGWDEPMRSRRKGLGPRDGPVGMRSENPNAEPPGRSPSPRQKRPGEITQEGELSPEEPRRADVPRERFISSSKHDPECFPYRPDSFTRAEKVVVPTP